MLNSTKTFLGHAKLARTRALARAVHSLRITDGNKKKLDWTEIGAAQDALLLELQAMFWDGVQHELKDMIRTLREWRSEELKDVGLEDEKNENIYGFDTFVDQVIESSREFSVQYGSCRCYSYRVGRRADRKQQKKRPAAC